MYTIFYMIIEGINLPDLTGGAAELDQSGADADIPCPPNPPTAGRLDLLTPDLEIQPIPLDATLWQAAEALASHDVLTRSEGLAQLVKSDAVRRSPLVAYLVATRLADPDIALRTRVVQVLADTLVLSQVTYPEAGDASAQPVSGAVQRSLVSYLGELRTRQIYALLQVVDFDRSCEPLVSCLLSYCSFAGEHLAEILADRNAPLSMRKQAAYTIGVIGYLDALPHLNRLAARLEVRWKDRVGGNGGNGSGLEELEPVPLDENDEASLLPVIQSSLHLLNAP